MYCYFVQNAKIFLKFMKNSIGVIILLTSVSGDRDYNVYKGILLNII